ncbi:MAG TPA: hypothetical protein VGJ20_18490 [Xanthobacteraceae bacterium]|jgi:hypothetical protein
MGPNHFAVPANATLWHLPPSSPGLNPKENFGDEIFDQIFKTHALKSTNGMRAKLWQVNANMELNPELV